MKTRKLFITLSFFALAIGAFSFALIKNNDQSDFKVVSAIDIDDYSDCEAAHNSHNASELLSALRTITSPGQAGSYNDLWETYKKAYVRADGYIFDYYSSITNYRPGTDQAGSYSKEGDKYNREHSIPKSWWGGGTTAGTQGADPFIVVPTDGFVNGGRSNYPFGMVGTIDKSYSNSKKGSGRSDFNYSGTVFEPDDSVKGDFARIVYYAIAKYEESYNWIQGEGDVCFTGSSSTNYGLTPYSIKLFSYWSELDPVSDWERSVNDKVAPIQKNRNPFIDHPEYANTLWGDCDNYTPYTHSVPPVGVSISPSSASITEGNTVSLTATSSDSSPITWSTSNSAVATVNQSGIVTGVKAGTVTITASATIDSTVYSATSIITVTVPKTLSSISVSGQKTSFVVGGTFTFGGVVTAHYNDSTSSNVTAYSSFSGYDLLTEGDQTVTVSYTEGDINKTTTYNIIVNPAGSGESDTFNTAYSYSEVGDTWQLTNYTTPSGYVLCPDTNSTTSVATFEDIFTDKTITSDVVITINSATYGSGTNPSSSTYSIYNSSECSSKVTATQTGTLPSSSTYTNVIYAISNSTASSSFTDDLALKITKPGKQIRLKTVTIEFDYETQGSSEPTLFSIEVGIEPDKLTYTAGECFDPAGLEIRRNYSDSSFDLYEYEGNESEFVFSPDLSSILSVDVSSISISYGGLNCIQAITVNPAPISLTSIGVTNAKTSYVVGDTFVKPTITAYFSDSSSNNVTNEATFSGYNMAIAGNYTVTVTYTYNEVTKSTSYTISVLTPTPIELEASLIEDRVFYVGEYINNDDIQVYRGSEKQYEFLFNGSIDYSYQFTYEDAVSGGAITYKTFENAISVGTEMCSLTVRVQRKAYEEVVEVTDVITADDLVATNTTYKDFSDLTFASNARYAGNSAKDASGCIQLRSKKQQLRNCFYN